MSYYIFSASNKHWKKYILWHSHLKYFKPVRNLLIKSFHRLVLSAYFNTQVWKVGIVGNLEIYSTVQYTQRTVLIEEGYRQKKRQRSSLLFGGDEFFQFLAAPDVLPWMILNNRMNCTRTNWEKRMNSSYFSKSSYRQNS